MSDMPGATTVRPSTLVASYRGANGAANSGDLGHAGAGQQLDPGAPGMQRERSAGGIDEAQLRSDPRTLPGADDHLAVSQDPDLPGTGGDVERRGVARHVPDAGAADPDLHDDDVVRLDAGTVRHHVRSAVLRAQPGAAVPAPPGAGLGPAHRRVGGGRRG